MSFLNTKVTEETKPSGSRFVPFVLRLLREGGNHTIHVNRAAKKVFAVPRHREIIEFTARRICKDLEIPRP